jgi:hypothetical protein
MRATERALRAPSVHNSQPWQWRISDGVVELHADPNRHLVGTDPDRRDLVISCGAALHHLRVALADLGVSTTTERLPDPEDGTLLAVMRTVDGPVDAHDAALASAIEERRSDRRAFREEPVQPAQLDLLTERAAAQGAGLVPVLSDGARARLAAVLGEAATSERTVPGYAAELAIWSRRHAGGHDGIPSDSRTDRHVGPESAGLRHFPQGQLGQAPHPLTAGPDGATLMVLTTPRRRPRRLAAGGRGHQRRAAHRDTERPGHHRVEPSGGGRPHTAAAGRHGVAGARACTTGPAGRMGPGRCRSPARNPAPTPALRAAGLDGSAACTFRTSCSHRADWCCGVPEAGPIS